MKDIDLQVGWGPFSQTNEGVSKREIFICTFAMLSKFVTVDGDISKKELMVIDHLMRQSLKLDDEKRKFVTKVFNLGKKSSTSFEEYVRRYKVALKEKPQMYEWLIDLLFRVSLADEILADKELDYLNSACKILGIPEDKFNEIRARYEAKDMAPYGVLDVSPETPFEEIRKKYDELLHAYDVERLINGGFAEELVDLAQKKQAQITAAFLKIRKQYEK